MMTPPENKVQVDVHPEREGACEWCFALGPCTLTRAVVFGRVFYVCPGCVAFLESRPAKSLDTKGI